MPSKKIIGIIPARFASTRFPGKPLASILGKTLLQRTYENALNTDVLSELIIATDDQRIFEHAKNFGAKVVMTSENCMNGTDRIAEVLMNYPDLQLSDAIVNIQGDEPCIDTKAINKAVDLLLMDPQAQMATLVAPLTTEEEINNPSVVKCVMDLHHNALYFSRSAIPSSLGHNNNEEIKCYKHIGLYIYRSKFLLELQKLSSTPLQRIENLEQLKVLEHGFKIKVAIASQGSLGVDHPEDLPKIERWLCEQNLYL